MAQHKIPATAGLIFIAASIVTAGSAMADKPSFAGGGKHDKHREKDRGYDRFDRRDRDDRQRQYGGDSYHDRDRPDFGGGRFFIDRHRTFIRDYYVNEFRTGQCPPGLAKKGNGCMPPGQAKKWAIGQPLPRDVVYYDLPPAILAGFGPPPPGYRFVRVASDILMIAIGTGMVMDAINDLGRY